MLSPSYLRRPESYDRLGAPVSSQQRFLANRLLVGGTRTAPGKRSVIITCFALQLTILY